MAEALLAGLCRTGRDPASIVVAEPNAERREQLKGKYSVDCSAENSTAAGSTACILAVKPQVLESVLSPLATVLQANRPLLISVAAGIPLASLDRWSGGSCAIVRAMPNTPALIGAGASALVANPLAGPEQRGAAESILAAVGITTWLSNESLMDVVTALSGSGPAYFFLVMDALCKAAVSHGLDPRTARQLCTQTAIGAATLAQTSSESLQRLRLNVTSPGGTTERGVDALERFGLEKAFQEAIDAARNRSRELAGELGGES